VTASADGALLTEGREAEVHLLAGGKVLKLMRHAAASPSRYPKTAPRFCGSSSTPRPPCGVERTPA